jgi:hypothetical protein
VLAVAIAAQYGSPPLVPVWIGSRYIFPKLGPTLVLNTTTNQLDALLPPIPVRKYDVLLTYETAPAGWRMPAGATNLVIFVNGLRYRAGYDYVITAGVIKAQYDNMLPEHQVTCDYDVGQ